MRSSRMTQTEGLIIPHFLREPNSIIVLYCFAVVYLLVFVNLSLEEAICIFPHLEKGA